MFKIGDRVVLQKADGTHKEDSIGTVSKIEIGLDETWVYVKFDNCRTYHPLGRDTICNAYPVNLFATEGFWLLPFTENILAPAKTICQCSIQDLLWCGHMPDCIEKKR